MSSLSIIVPVGPAEQTLGDLPDKLLAAFTRDHTLALNLRDWELIVVFCEGSGH